jgi:uncharacterized membrane-anchored protein
MKKALLIILISILALPALAYDVIPDPGVTTVDQLIAKIYKIMDVIFALLIVFAVGFILYAGYIYVSAGGDKEKAEKANKMIIFAAVGVLVAIFAKAIPVVVKNILQ